MKLLLTLNLVLTLLLTITSTSAQKKILVDVAHGQKFYSDPADNRASDLVPAQRLAYMTSELSKNGAANHAQLNYQKTPITKDALSKCDLLFIHIPSMKYSADECTAIRQYLEKGGSLFIVMEVDYWATLEQANVNDIVKPLGITFTTDNPDESSGGYSRPGKITKQRYTIPSHGARMVEGGTPFAFSVKSDANPIGVFKELNGGGKIIAMGDGMVSLYMTSWQGVEGYQCSEFMNDAMAWLLE